jgi:hypothetical protein
LQFERRAIGEIVSSLSMLAITIAVLGGFGILSMQSIKSSSSILTNGAQEAARDAGLLLTLVSVETNSSGTFVWLFNYGWESRSITSVYLNGGILQGWSSSCLPIRAKSLCTINLSQNIRGEVTVFFGVKSIAVSL